MNMWELWRFNVYCCMLIYTLSRYIYFIHTYLLHMIISVHINYTNYFHSFYCILIWNMKKEIYLILICTCLTMRVNNFSSFFTMLLLFLTPLFVCHYPFVQWVTKHFLFISESYLYVNSFNFTFIKLYI